MTRQNVCYSTKSVKQEVLHMENERLKKGLEKLKLMCSVVQKESRIPYNI